MKEFRETTTSSISLRAIVTGSVVVRSVTADSVSSTISPLMTRPSFRTTSRA
ncbi:hypothetical protein D3C83_296570 [compost metagenome]